MQFMQWLEIIMKYLFNKREHATYFSAQNKRKLLSRQGRVSTEPVRKCFFRFLPGFSGSAVGSLNITVNEYTELREM